LIADEKLDYLIFFWDPLQSLPHDVDVEALLRIAVLYNVPTACNRATADLIISSPLFHSAEYEPAKERAKKWLLRTLCWSPVNTAADSCHDSNSVPELSSSGKDLTVCVNVKPTPYRFLQLLQCPLRHPRTAFQAHIEVPYVASRRSFQ